MNNGLTVAQSAERIGRITGSRVGAVLGLSKYASRDDVMRELVREHFGKEREFSGNDATRYGQAHESDAIDAYERQTGELVLHTGQEQKFFVHPEYDWLAAHPDGITASGVYCEVKCPFRAKYTKPDDNYFAQIQLGMACARHYVPGFRDCADFIVWREGEPIIVERVECDLDWIPRNLGNLQNFMDEYRETIADPAKAAPYLADKERDDADWRDAVSRWQHAKREADAYAELEKHARATLIEMAPQGAKGCGVSLARVETEGRVDYKRAITQMLPDVDLSAFKGKPSISYRITESKA